MVLSVRRAGGEGRRHHHGQDQQPDDGTARHLRQFSVRPNAQSFRRAQERRRLLGRQRRSRGRRAGAVRRRHRCRRLDPHPGCMVQPGRLQGLVRPQSGGDAAQRLRRLHAIYGRGSDQPHRRGRGAGVVRARGIRRARSFQYRDQRGFRGGDPPLDQGLEDRLQPRSRRLSGRAGGSRRRRQGRRSVCRRGGDGRARQARPQAQPARTVGRLGPLDRAAQHRRARGHEGGRHRPFGPAPRRLSAGISALDRCRPEAFGDGRRPRPGDPHRSLRRDPGRPRRAPDPGVTDARLHAGRQPRPTATPWDRPTSTAKRSTR